MTDIKQTKLDRIASKSGDPLSERQAERLYDYAAEMEMMLREAVKRFLEIKNELPRDEGWWTATDRRMVKTMGQIQELLK